MWNSLRSRRPSARCRHLCHETLERRQLLAASVLLEFELTDSGGSSVGSVNVGDDFSLEAYVEDIRSSPSGILQAFFDVTYPASLMSTSGPVYAGSEYASGASGDVSGAGVIDDAGGADSDGIPPAPPSDRFLLFRIPFHADTAGTVTLVPSAAGDAYNNVVLFPASNVSFSDILLGGTSFEITAAPVPEVSLAKSTGGDGSEQGPKSGQFTVSLSETTSTATVVSYSVAGTATEGTDYASLAVKTVTIPAGQTEATIDISVTDDSEIEPTETLQVTLDAITSGDPNVAIDTAADQATLDIADNDSATLSAAKSANGDGSETGPDDGQFTVTLSNASSTATTVAYSLGGTANEGSDYQTIADQTVTIPAGQTEASIAVAVIDDLDTEPSETVVLVLGNVTSGHTSQISVDATPATLDIADNDSATVSIAQTTHADENGPVDGRFTVSLSRPSSADTTVTFSIDPTGTAQSGDYTIAGSTVAIPAGLTSATIDVSVTQDDLIEGDETVALTLSGVAAGGALVTIDPAGNQAQLTIADDDTATVSVLKSTDGDASEAGPDDGQFTVSLSSPSSSDTTIAYSASGTATEGTDYATLPGEVTIPAGGTEAFILVDVSDDSATEGPETVVLTLGGITSGHASQISVNPALATLSILDDDIPRVSIERTSNASEAGLVSGQFTVRQSLPTAEPTIITYAVAGTAVPGVDYTVLSGSVTIPAGETSATIDVPVSHDNLVEPVETVEISLTTVSGNSLLQIDSQANVATVDIVDNDAVTVDITQSQAVDEGGSVEARFTVTLSSLSSTDTIVGLGFSGTATSNVDYTPVIDTITIPAQTDSVTITVGVRDDTLLEPSETVQVTLESVTSDAEVVISSTRNVYELTINDDDTATASVLKSAGGDANEAGPVDGQFTVSLSSPSSVDTTIAYTLGGTATEGSDYQNIVDQTVTIPAGDTEAFIPVAVSDDSDMEGAETVELALTSVASGHVSRISVDTTPATLLILDDETPLLSIETTTGASEADVAVPGRFTVRQNLLTSEPTVVTYSVSGTATPDADYTALGGTVTIPAGESFATIDVSVIDDELLEGLEDVTVTLTGIISGNSQIELDATQAEATLSIADGETGLIRIAKSENGDADEAGPVDGQFTLTQDGITASDTVIAYTIGGTASSADDYQALTNTVTILAGQTSATIDIVVVDDTLVEPTETVEVTLGTSTSGDPNVAIDTTAAQATLAMADNDSATVSIAKSADGDASEAGPDDGQFTVSLSQPSSTDTQVAYTIENTSTATEGSDYATHAVKTVTIPAGDTEAFITVGAIDDQTIEATEQVTIRLTTVTSTDSLAVSLDAADQASLDILDNDSATVSIATRRDGSETDPTPGAFVVTLSAASATDTRITYAIDAASTATETDDYTALSGSVTIAAGQTEAEILVTVLDDDRLEGTETLVVTLQAIDEGALQITLHSDPANLQATLDIAEEETGLVGIAKSVNGDGSEAGSNGGQFTLTQNGITTSDTVITYTVGGTATEGGDFDNLATKTVTIPAGQTTATIDVGVIDDTLVEPSETVEVALGTITAGSPNVAIDTSAAQATLDIADDDSATVSLARSTDGHAAEAGPDNGQFTVTLSNPSSTDTTVTYTLGGTATEGDDYATLPTKTITIAAGDTEAFIAIGVVDDQTVEPTEDVTASLTAVSGVGNPAITLGAADQASLDIVDNDSATVSLAKATGGDASESGPVDGRFIVSLSSPSSTDTVVTFLAAGGTAGSTDYTLSGDTVAGDTVAGNTVTIPAGETSATIRVAVVNDSAVEGDETVRVELTAIDPGGNGQITIDTTADEAALTISDNDTATIAFAAATGTAIEATASHSIDVVLTVPGGGTISEAVSLDVADLLSGTAGTPGDYSLGTTTLTFAAGSADGQIETVNLTLVVDQALESDETVDLRISLAGSPIGGRVTLGSPSSHSLTIIDDPMTATLSGFVWADTNDDGTHDEHEAGLVGVEVTLSGEDLRGQTVEVVTYSDSDGSYHFTDLPGGTYDIVETHPTAFYDAAESLGTVDGSASGAVAADRFNGVVLPPAGEGIDYDFGERGLQAPYITLRLFLASTPPIAEMLPDIHALAEEREGDASQVEAIREGNRPEVRQIGSEVTFRGFDSDDAFRFTPAGSDLAADGTRHTVEVNGQTWTYPVAEVDSVRFDGGSGNDRVELNDTSGDDSLVASGDTATLSFTDFELEAFAFELVQANSASGGNDTADEQAIDFVLELEGDWGP